MAGETIAFKSNGPSFAERLVGLTLLIFGGFWLYALAALAEIPPPGHRVESWLAMGVWGILGMFFGRVGLSFLFGVSGAYCDGKAQEIVFWRRNLLFMRSSVRCPLDQFTAIRVQKTKQRGGKVTLHGYAVTLSSKDGTEKVGFFDTKNEAVESAKRLAACTHLAIEVE